MQEQGSDKKNKARDMLTFLPFMFGMCVVFAASMIGLAFVMPLADTISGALAVLSHGLVALCAGAIIFIAIKSALRFPK